MAAFAVVSGWVGLASGAPVWVGDFETGNLDQWTNKLNPAGIQVVQDPVVEGLQAAHITLTNNDTWSNGLHRVELQHRPDAARTKDGSETWFAWSFYLPAELPASPTAQIGYWESQQSYKQMMTFEASGTSLKFITRQPTNKTHWTDANALTAKTWHRIAMHIVWSKSDTGGSVDVWFDGQQVVTAATAKTLNDDNPHFTQVGLLRGTASFSDAPEIVIDGALEGDSLLDVSLAAPDGGAGAAGAAGNAGSSGAAGAGGGAGAGSGGTSGGGSGGGSAGTGGSPDAGTGGKASARDSEDDEGCGCRVAGRSSSGGALAGLLLFGMALGRRRRR